MSLVGNTWAHRGQLRDSDLARNSQTVAFKYVSECVCVRERDGEGDRQTKPSIEENRQLFGPADFMAFLFMEELFALLCSLKAVLNFLL